MDSTKGKEKYRSKLNLEILIRNLKFKADFMISNLGFIMKKIILISNIIKIWNVYKKGINLIQFNFFKSVLSTHDMNINIPLNGDWSDKIDSELNI